MRSDSMLRVEKAGGGWCPKQQVERGIREFIQVDLEDVHVVTGIQTQGRYDRGRGQEYAEEYTVEYWRPGLEEWRGIQEMGWEAVFSMSPDIFTTCILSLSRESSLFR
ncbi:hypothetical protein NQ317_012758 [Molorchus minor]|uniref:F5/8 type C domain-containing protein n=1 Tax=Molorchus minor TaxID=1323400 RepID=A0ABQ9K3V6_9CUCU|nr:hypothetical protein NQ317_012758 [Molorchus minor]